jgi:hypothetical protein
MQIEEFRSHLELFHEALSRETLAFVSGRTGSPDFAGVYAGYSDLYGEDAVRDLDSQLARTPESFPSRRKSFQRLRSFAVGHHLAYRTASLGEQIARDECSGSFVWDGVPMHCTSLPWLLRREPDANRRRALRQVQTRRARDIAPVYVERLAELRKAASALGYATPLEALQASTGVDYSALSGTLETLVAATEPDYADRLAGSFGASLGLDAGAICECDVGRWRTGNEPSAFFPAELLDPALDRLVAELEIRPESESAIVIDVENRQGKPQGAWCIPVLVPQEVHVIASRGAGAQDFAVLLHESGHAHHFAWTAASVGAEYRLWGDRAVGEAFGFIFERLVRNESWLIENLGFARSGAFLKFGALEECFEIRRQIGMLRYQMALYGAEGSGDAGDRYAGIMGQHTGIRHAPELWTTAAGDTVRSADYLRGWVLESMLHDYLCTRYGTGWHRNRAAGMLLKEIWETGQLYSADELSRELGLGRLDPQILTDRLLRGLQR